MAPEAADRLAAWLADRRTAQRGVVWRSTARAMGRRHGRESDIRYMYQSQTVVVLKRTTTRNERCFGDAASYRELMPPARMSVTK